MIEHTVVATLFGVLTAIVIAFQLALALGAPWGHLAMGGRYPGQFPPKMRVAALIQIVILAFLALIVSARVGLVGGSFAAFAAWGIWGVVLFDIIGVILNLITPSKWERIIWTPVTIIMFVCSLWVALS